MSLKIVDIAPPVAALTREEQRWLAAFRRMDRTIVHGQLLAMEAVSRSFAQCPEPRLQLVPGSAT